jgi:hypothetical protein
MTNTTPPKSPKTITVPSAEQLGRYRKPLGGLLLLAVVCGLSFYGGTQYQKDHSNGQVTPSTRRTDGTMNQPFGLRGQGGFRGQRGNLGSVTAISAASITVRSATTTTYSISSDTIIMNGRQAAAASDIKVGDTVAVSANPSDNTHAARIVINPGPASRPTSNSQSPNPTDITTN